LEIDIFKKIQETKDVILSEKNFKPLIAIVAGSGLSKISLQFEDRKVIKYSKVPHFPKEQFQAMLASWCCVLTKVLIY
jgi:purine nucleoside phosphorylase